MNMSSVQLVRKRSNKYCEHCDLDVGHQNWTRHLNSESHAVKRARYDISEWAKQMGIHNYNSRSSSELEKIKSQLDERKTDYSVFNLDKLREIASQMNINNYNAKDREKLLSRLEAIHKKPNTLRYRTLDYLQEQAKIVGAWNMLGKTRQEIRKEIYQKRKIHYCEVCKTEVQDFDLHKIGHEHTTKIGGGSLNSVEELSKKGDIKKIVFNNTNKEIIDIPNFFAANNSEISSKIANHVASKRSVKLNFTLECEYVRKKVDESNQFTEMTFHTNAVSLHSGEDNIQEVIDKAINEITSKESNYQPSRGSGWSLYTVKRLIVALSKFKALKGNSYIKLAKWVSDKKACVNIKNNDDFCFIYSILCALDTPKIKPERPSHYSSRVNEEIFQGFDYPLSLTDIIKFEKKSLNKYPKYPSMAINVYEATNKKEICPVLVSKNLSAEKTIDLLLLQEGNKKHYVYIKNLSRLVRSQLTKHTEKTYICRRCLWHFSSQDKLSAHTIVCGTFEPCKAEMPSEGSIIKFTQYNNKFEHPFVIYYDFESLLVPIDDDNLIQNTGQTKEKEKKDDTSYTIKMKKHVPYSFCIYLVSRVNEEFYEPYLFRATTSEELKLVPQKFIEKLLEILEMIQHKYENPQKIRMTGEAEQRFQEATICHICEKQFSDGSKHRDHCHLTIANDENKKSNYLGAACSSCNQQRQLPRKIPAIAHSASSYDMHTIILAAHNYEPDQFKTTVIANTEENYITITKDMIKMKKGHLSICFIDSFRFLATSLEKLANNLRVEDFTHLNKYVETQQFLNGEKSDIFNMLKVKGVQPYDFISSLERLEYTEMLKPEDFFDSLNDEKISHEDYEHYKHVWSCLTNKSLGIYSDWYNILDTILIACIFEKFRDVCLKNYNLDAANFVTLPSLSWAAMLKMTNVEIELLSDYSMQLQIEKGIRGGLSQVVKRYCAANNKYLANFDKSQSENYLFYIDANNLYGWALCQPLPYKGFKWIEPSTKSTEEWKTIILDYSDESQEGLILDVHLRYPHHIHDFHSDFPLAPHHYNKKLCGTLLDKTDYVVHIRNLKLYLQLGLELSAVNKIISFEQRAFLKPFIDFNTTKRAHATSEFERDFYKLVNNAIFGRSMMNLRKRRDIRLATEDQALKLVRKPTFSRLTMFNDNFFACHMARNKIKFTQPLFLGLATLELSKLLMYDFYYNKLKVIDPSIKLLMTDTDSFLIETTKDPYDIISENYLFFDTSNYPKNHSCFSLSNNKVIGVFKDELAGSVLKEFCGLRSKLYNFTYEDKNQVKCKGIKKIVAKRTICMDDFKSCLFNSEDAYRQQILIRSYKHQLYTIKQQKLCLSSQDDKRAILNSDVVNTLPWGHYKLAEKKENDLMEVDDD